MRHSGRQAGVQQSETIGSKDYRDVSAPLHCVLAMPKAGGHDDN